MIRKQKNDYVAEAFNRAATSYDEPRIIRSCQPCVREVCVGRLASEPETTVLGLGRGTGWATPEMASRLQGGGAPPAA